MKKRVFVFQGLFAAFGVVFGLLHIGLCEGRERAGREPSRDQKTFSDSLLRPDWQSGGPGFDGRSLEANDVAIEDLHRIVVERNSLIDSCDFFGTLSGIIAQQRAVDIAATNARQAWGRAKASQAAANAIVPVNADAAAAKDSVQAAATRDALAAQAVEQRYVAELQKLAPMLQKLEGKSVRWAEFYGRMSEFAPRSRRDLQRADVLAVLRQQVQSRKDFLEGHFLIAMYDAYAGNAQAAANEIDRGMKIAEPYGETLYPFMFMHDALRVSNMAMQTKPVARFKAWLERESDKNSLQRWLLATSFALKGGAAMRAESEKHFRAALSRLGFFPLQKFQGNVPSHLAGDASHFFLAGKLKPDLDLAAAIMSRSADDRPWQSARANAALAAHEGRWVDAVKHIENCLLDCPGTLEEEVKAEAESYRKNRTWSRP